MTRNFVSMIALAGLALAATGCASLKSAKNTTPINNWYLDPATEMVNYKTYGFLQVTACRYQDPAGTTYRRTFWQKIRGKKATAKRPEIHHTDELVWRTLEAEMNQKGYTRADPQRADLLVVYYGGPRPSTPMKDLGIKSGAFDAYFTANELHDDTFFVDIIDNQAKKLVYRGWDNTTFHENQFPDADKVVDCATDTIRFFPSKR